MKFEAQIYVVYTPKKEVVKVDSQYVTVIMNFESLKRADRQAVVRISYTTLILLLNFKTK